MKEKFVYCRSYDNDISVQHRQNQTQAEKKTKILRIFIIISTISYTMYPQSFLSHVIIFMWINPLVFFLEYALWYLPFGNDINF